MPTPERIVIESMFKIVNKEGDTVPFKLNSAQRQIDNRLTGHDLYPKARQEGVSSYFLARNTALCLTRPNTRAVVISHEKEATERMLAKVHFFLRNISPLPPVLENSSKSEITFPKTNSMFYIGTAGQKAFGRGDTITNLHCSEVAYWPDQKGLMRGLLQAVPYQTGEISIESTGKGQGNWYHSICMRAQSGRSRYRVTFLPWHTFPEYTVPVTPDIEKMVMANLLEELEEPELVEKFGLDAGRILWRRDKLEELEYDLSDFKQEYPMSLDEAFQASGYSIFPQVNYVPDSKWIKVDGKLSKLEEHPIAGRMYAIGADVGAGVGSDNSVIEIYDLETLEQVAEWAYNKMGPDVFAHKIVELGLLFNEAYLSVESNNHGIVTLKEIQNLKYPLIKINRMPAVGKKTDEVGRLVDMGVRTSARSKPYIIGKAKKYLHEGFIIHSEALKLELSTFIETDSGKLEAEQGCLDDRVMALCIGLYGIEKAHMAFGQGSTQKPKEEEQSTISVYSEFSLESIIREMRKRGQGELPFRRQVA